ncbi:MAG: hypothetical protein ACFB2W_24550, partial [Leptolyngbyaceae cyanobacterium]
TILSLTWGVSFCKLLGEMGLFLAILQHPSVAQILDSSTFSQYFRDDYVNPTCCFSNSTQLAPGFEPDMALSLPSNLTKQLFLIQNCVLTHLAWAC